VTSDVEWDEEHMQTYLQEDLWCIWFSDGASYDIIIHQQTNQENNDVDWNRNKNGCCTLFESALEVGGSPNNILTQGPEQW